MSVTLTCRPLSSYPGTETTNRKSPPFHRAGGWVSLAEWSGQVVPWLLNQVGPKADGEWTLAGVVEVTLPGREVAP